jgi:hypothetical protein
VLNRLLSLLHSLYHRLMFGGTSRLSRLETDCLAQFMRRLDHRGKLILNQQLARLTLIQRFSRGKMVLFFDPRDPMLERGWPSNMLFPLWDEEIRVMSISIGVGAGQVARCDIVCNRGRLFSLEFSKNVEPMKKSYSIIGSELLFDVMQSTLPPSKNVDRYIRAIDAGLPNDYFELATRSEELIAGRWRIFGIHEIGKISLPEGNFYILAEYEEVGRFAVRQGDRSGQVYFLGLNTEELPVSRWSSLKPAISAIQGSGEA